MRIGRKEFAYMVGAREEEVPVESALELERGNLEFRFFSEREKEEKIRELRRAIMDGSFEKSGPSRKKAWEKGWSENLELVRRKGISRETLRPMYVKHDVLRYRGNYIHTENRFFEESVYTALRIFIAGEYLEGSREIVEFGCGTGSSIHLFSTLLPGKRFIACDWADSSMEIINIMARETGRDIRAFKFDMFDPGSGFSMGRDSAVFTFTAMEQLGREFEAFSSFLLEKKPGICVHVEPILEFYDESDPFDQVAILYHKKRNYLEGFWPWLERMEARDRLCIIYSRRMHFGTLYHEGYNLVVWKPA